MSAINPISSVKFARLIGAPMRPALIDVRVDGTGMAPFAGAIAMGTNRSTISTNQERER
jgi:hypothetical protein